MSPSDGSFSCEPLPDRAGVEGRGPRWLVSVPGRGRFVWEGFETGPVVLSGEELEALSRHLLGIGLEEVGPAATRELRPFVSDGKAVPSLLLHSATPALRNLEADVNDALAGRTPEDGAANVETRAVARAQSGDLVVGRTGSWRTAARLAGVEAVSVPGLKYYYLSHALLRLAAQSHGAAPALARIAEALRARPDTVVRVYVLDREMQVLLLYLKRLAGIEALNTDANSPEVSDYWNRKTTLHPSVEDALAADLASATAEGRLAEETERSPLARRLGVRFARMPGYAVAVDDDEQATIARLLAAAHLLRERYWLRLGCLKPYVGGAGARIVTGIPLDDDEVLRRLAAAAFARRESCVLEAHVDYLRHRVGRETLLLAPSGHVRHGRLADGLTLQFVRGNSWQGNVYVDEGTSADLGLSAERYREIVGALGALYAGFTGNGLGLVTAGFDFAVGRVGGAFADRVLVGVQDPNMRSHSAELLRTFLDELRESGGARFAATKVVHPAPGVSLPLLRSLKRASPAGRRFRVLTVLAGRWGMIAAAARSPTAAVEDLLAAENELARLGHVTPAAHASPASVPEPEERS